MKHIVAFLLGLSCLSANAMDADKQMHLGASYNLTSIAYTASEDRLTAAAISLSLGLYKEYTLDSNVSDSDIKYNLLGTALALIIPFRIEF